MPHEAQAAMLRVLLDLLESMRVLQGLVCAILCLCFAAIVVAEYTAACRS